MGLRKNKKRLLSTVLLLAAVMMLPFMAHAENNVKMTLRPGEGTGEAVELYLTPSSQYELPECTFTAPEGKEFDRWYVTLWGVIPLIDNAHEDGMYNVGETIPVPAASGADLAAEARWKDKYYTVEFIMNGANDQEPTQTIRHGDPAAKPYSYSHKKGYIFVDWYLEESLETVYDFDERKPVSGDLKLYAGWGNYTTATAYEEGAVTASHAGSVKIDDKEWINATSKLVLDGETATFYARADKTGYRFAGWYKNSRNVAMPIPEGDPITTEPEFTAVIDTDTQYYCAVFERCKATFDTRGGSLIDPVYADDEGKIKEPKRPTGQTSEYTFEGWYTSKDFSEDSRFDFNTVLTDDITLYARYRVSASVSPYDLETHMTSGGGKVKFTTSSRYSAYGESKIFREGEESSVTAEAEEGYEFVGWTDGMPDGDIIGSNSTWYFTADGPHYFYAVFSKEHRHVWGDWVRLKEPTETEDGLAERVCELDPTHVETVKLYYNEGGNDGSEPAPPVPGGRVSPDTGVDGSPVLYAAVLLAVSVPLGMIFRKRED